MSTRGDITVVSEGHYYSHYQHCDMYPSGHVASLLREAADITRQGQWDEVASGWTQKTWLVPKDDELPRALRNTVKHPDGDDYKRSDWSYGNEASPLICRHGCSGLSSRRRRDVQRPQA